MNKNIWVQYIILFSERSTQYCHNTNEINQTALQKLLQKAQDLYIFYFLPSHLLYKQVCTDKNWVDREAGNILYREAQIYTK